MPSRAEKNMRRKRREGEDGEKESRLEGGQWKLFIPEQR